MPPSTVSSLYEKSPLLETNKRSSHRNREKSSDEGRYVLVIHGGAGTMSRDRSTPELRAKYKAALSNALRAGYAVLKDGGEAMDAAVAAVSSMEGETCRMNGFENGYILILYFQIVRYSIREKVPYLTQEGR